MSDSSKSNRRTDGVWMVLKKAATRLQDWFAMQSVAAKLGVVALAVLIPATAIYSAMLPYTGPS